MIRDRQKLLGRFVIETIQGHQQEIRVIGEGGRVLFDYPYNHIVEPENSDTKAGSRPSTDLLESFYTLKEQWWIEGAKAEPRRGKHLRSFLADAGFREVTASARYISYGDMSTVRRFGEDRARECEGSEMARGIIELRLRNEAELQSMATAWRVWGGSATTSFPTIAPSDLHAAVAISRGVAASAISAIEDKGCYEHHRLIGAEPL